MLMSVRLNYGTMLPPGMNGLAPGSLNSGHVPPPSVPPSSVPPVLNPGPYNVMQVAGSGV